MNILDLPNETLQNIASHLSKDSLATFAMAHERFRAVAYNVSECMKLNKLSPTMMQYLRLNGCAVRCLNLEGCDAPSHIITEAIMMCPNISSLNILDTAITFDNLLKVLQFLAKGLRNLKMSFINYDINHYFCLLLPKLEYVLIEAIPAEEYDKLLVDMKFIGRFLCLMAPLKMPRRRAMRKCLLKSLRRY